MTSPNDDGLTPEEHKLFERAMGLLDRGSVKLPPTVREAIMRRIREAPAPFWKRAWSWLAEPRIMAASPLALAASLAVIVTASVLTANRLGGAPEAGRADPSVMDETRVTRFLLVDPRASRVAVTGTFANWDPSGVPLKRLADGLWAGELTLRPGLYQYVFVVDGTDWRVDANAAWSVDDGLGRRNSVVFVPGERS